jgi:ornithine carrier protein
VQAQLRRYNGEAVPLLTSSTLAAAEAAPLSMAQLSIAAAAAGAVTSCVLTPIELVKCRMQVQQLSNPGVAPKLLPGPLALVRDTLRTHGLRGLWLGQTGTLLRETGGGMAWFLAFEGVCRAAQTRRRNAGRKAAKQDLSAPELMLAGACAGVGYNVVLFPVSVVRENARTGQDCPPLRESRVSRLISAALLRLKADSVKSTMQTTAELARAGAGAAADVAPATARNGFVATFRDIYRRRGVRGLYAGCGVTCLRSGPSSGALGLARARERERERRVWTLTRLDTPAPPPFFLPPSRHDSECDERRGTQLSSCELFLSPHPARPPRPFRCPSPTTATPADPRARDDSLMYTKLEQLADVYAI